MSGGLKRSPPEVICEIVLLDVLNAGLFRAIPSDRDPDFVPFLRKPSHLVEEEGFVLLVELPGVGGVDGVSRGEHLFVCFAIPCAGKEAFATLVPNTLEAFATLGSSEGQAVERTEAFATLLFRVGSRRREMADLEAFATLVHRTPAAGLGAAQLGWRIANRNSENKN